MSFFFSKKRSKFFILVDVPAEFDVQSPLKEDCVDHQIIASKVECIELLRLKPMVSKISINILIRLVDSRLYLTIRNS